jgi:hypothetical protein
MFSDPAKSVFVVCCLLSMLGCGPSRPDTVPVSGRLTYGGGDWPKPGRVYFTPLEPAEGFPRRAGRADFEPDGRFRVGTWEDGDGLMPGKYRISIECWRKPPSMGDPDTLSYVPVELRIASRSPWEIEIAVDGDPVEIERDVPKRE